MTPPVVAILWAALAASPALAQIPWNNDLRTAHAQAKQEGKLLLMHFYSDNCVWCDRLEAGAFQSTALAEAIASDYVPVKIHAGMNPRIAKTFRVSRFPTDVIVTTDGTVLSHGVSPQDPNKFIGLLAQHALDQPAPNAQPTQNESLAGTNAAADRQQTANPPVAMGPSASLPQQAAFPQVAPPAPQAVTGSPLPQANPYAPAPQPAPAAQEPTASPPRRAVASATATPPAAAIGAAQPDQTGASPQENAGFTLPPQVGGTPAHPAGYRDTASAMPASDSEQPPATASFSDETGSPSSVAGAPRNSDQITINPELAADLTQAGSSSTADDPASLGQTAADEADSADPPPVALQGFCPVTLVQQEQWVAGQPEFGLIHLGQLYLFTDQNALETFRANPEPYTPVMNSNDVVLFFREQRIVEGRRDWGVFDPEFNRIFLFANEDTMNHFQKHYQHYVRNAIMLTRQAAADASTQLR